MLGVHFFIRRPRFVTYGSVLGTLLGNGKRGVSAAGQVHGAIVDEPRFRVDGHRVPIQVLGFWRRRRGGPLHVTELLPLHHTIVHAHTARNGLPVSDSHVPPVDQRGVELEGRPAPRARGG